MSLTIPTTKELKEQNLANLESNINQTSPLADKAFLRVLAAMEALQNTPLYKYAVERSLQNLALTASGDDLDKIGSEYGVNRKPAEAAQLEIDLPATDGTIIPATTSFIGDSNGERYYPDASATASGGSAIIDPNGNYLAGPLFDREGILYADLDLSLIPKSRFDFDVVGEVIVIPGHF